jgi:hypothetical protein
LAIFASPFNLAATYIDRWREFNWAFVYTAQHHVDCDAASPRGKFQADVQAAILVKLWETFDRCVLGRYVVDACL